jgi:hypothetical protein
MGFLDRVTKSMRVVVGVPPREDDVVLTDAIPGTALIRHSARDQRRSDDDPDPRRMSWAKYELDLEVSVEGRDPYPVTDTFKVPNRYFDITPGVSLPVRVEAETPEQILVDWDAFDAAGGQEIVEKAADQRRRGQPKRQKEAVEAAQAQAVAQVTDQLDGYVAKGMMTPEQAESQKRANALAAADELDDPPEIGANSSREDLEWHLKRGLIDQATFDALIANNPNLK